MREIMFPLVPIIMPNSFSLASFRKRMRNSQKRKVEKEVLEKEATKQTLRILIAVFTFSTPF